MKKQLLQAFFIGLIAALPGCTSHSSGTENNSATANNSGTVNISGTWKFSVDLDSAGHRASTFLKQEASTFFKREGDKLTTIFVLKQEGDKLTGTYNSPLGQREVTGTVAGAKAVFGFDFTVKGETRKGTYTGNIESPTKMAGTLELGMSGGKGSGKGKMMWRSRVAADKVEN
jgi:hypothetical protein